MVLTDSVTVSNIITTGHITANKIMSRTWEPLAGFTDVQIKADQVYFGKSRMANIHISICKMLESCICRSGY
ncbi:MAG: hypothetical protein ACKPKO_31520 [Candidatus Fonsibacter sp.]